MTLVGIVSQARMGSTRLPGKVMMVAKGKTMLAHHLTRLRYATMPVFVATTTNDSDDQIVDEAARVADGVFRGPERDVLGRYVEAARAFDLDVIVRVTSDCPLIDAQLVRAGVEEYLRLNDDNVYVSNVVTRTYPRGFDFEVFSRSALEDAHENARDEFDREHVTPYLNRNVSGRMRLRDVIRSSDASRYRLTLDTRDDLLLLRRIVEHHDAALMNAEELIGLLESRPDLVEINANVSQTPLPNEH